MAERDRPADWESPLAESIASGLFDEIDQLSQDHYKLRII